METAILFGAGYDGREILQFLGSGRVHCFADNQLYGTVIQGKNVISVEELKRESRRHPVLIASSRYGDEMKTQLLKEGIHNFFQIQNLKPPLQHRVGYQFNGKFKGVSYDEFLRKYRIERYHSFCIYGLDGFSPYFAHLVQERAGTDALIYFCRSKNDGVSCLDTAFPVYDRLGDVPDFECLFLNAAHQDDDMRMKLEEADRTPAIVDLKLPDLVEPSFHHGSLRRFRDIHRGERCFLIGNGPSLKIEDLDVLRKHNAITFGTNRIFHAFPSTCWRPDYYVCIDFRLTDCIGEMAKYSDDVKHCFYSDMKHILGKEVLAPRDGLSVVHLINQPYMPNLPSFSRDIENGIFEGYTVTYAAIQIAVYMGFKEIYLLGMDHMHTPSGVAHFYGEKTFGEPCMRMGREEIDHSMTRATLAYRKAEHFSRRHGFRIYNATRGGQLEEFERMDFEQIFR